MLGGVLSIRVISHMKSLCFSLKYKGSPSSIFKAILVWFCRAWSVSNHPHIKDHCAFTLDICDTGLSLPAHLLLRDGPFHVGCWDECPLSDKEVPFVWPQPRQYLPAAAALPRSPRDPLPPSPGSAHCNRDARCHSPAPFWMAESVCCPARHSCRQADRT